MRSFKGLSCLSATDDPLPDPPGLAMLLLLLLDP